MGRDAQRRDSSGQAEYLRIPRLRGGLGLESIRVIYPVEGIAFRLRASDDKLPAEMRSEVCAQVSVRDSGSQLAARVASRRRHGMDFLPKWAGSDSEFSGDARESVNLTGVRARHIDHDGRLNHAS